MKTIKTTCAAVCLAVCGILSARAEIKTYPVPQALYYAFHNDDYTVKVRQAGKKEWIDLYEYNVKVDMDTNSDATLVQFDFSGHIEIKVQKNNGELRSAVIRPLSKGIIPVIEEDAITFEIDRPQKLSIEFNNDRLHNLHLFANALEKNIPRKGDKAVNPQYKTMTAAVIRNITVRNSTLWADIAHAINIGTHGNTKTEGEVLEQMRFENLDILEHDEDDPDYQSVMSINAGDHNLVRDVWFDNIRVERIQEGQLFHLRVIYLPKYCTEPGRGVHDITFCNIHYAGKNENPSVIQGYDAQRTVENITFENIVINGKKQKRSRI